MTQVSHRIWYGENWRQIDGGSAYVLTILRFATHILNILMFATHMLLP